MITRKGSTPEEWKKRWAKTKVQAPNIIAVVALNHFKRHFQIQGYTSDNGFERWPARASGARYNSGRALLVRTGRLKRSIRIISRTWNNITVGTDVPYARGHNYGVDERRTVNVKAHTRRGNNVKAHTRNAHIRLPRRQFIGDSRALHTAIARAIFKRLNKM